MTDMKMEGDAKMEVKYTTLYNNNTSQPPSKLIEENLNISQSKENIQIQENEENQGKQSEQIKVLSDQLVDKDLMNMSQARLTRYNLEVIDDSSNLDKSGQQFNKALITPQVK